MSRMNWKKATREEMLDFIAAARTFASTRSSPAVRMFVFQLCKGVEMFIRKEDKRAETQKQA